MAETPIECARCGDTGVYVKDGLRFVCQCVEARMKRERRKHSGIPEYTPRPRLPTTEDYINRYDEIKANGNSWLAFMGRSGSGKSTQAFMIADALYQRKSPVYSKVYYYPDLVRNLSALRFDAFTYGAKIDDAFEPELIILDDFLDVVPKPDSFEEQVALDLIKRRYAQQKPMIITTELAPSGFRKLMPRHCEALFGRIVERCDGRVNVMKDAANYRLSPRS